MHTMYFDHSHPPFLPITNFTPHFLFFITYWVQFVLPIHAWTWDHTQGARLTYQGPHLWRINISFMVKVEQLHRKLTWRRRLGELGEQTMIRNFQGTPEPVTTGYTLSSNEHRTLGETTYQAQSIWNGQTPTTVQQFKKKIVPSSSIPMFTLKEPQTHVVYKCVAL